MEVQGTITAVLPQRNGTSKAGKPWCSASYVLQTQEQYPKHVCFDVLNENITKFNLRQGEYVKVSFNIDAREYNGKWYNSIKAWSVQRVDAGQVQQQQPTAFTNAPQSQQAYQPQSSQPQQPQQGTSASAPASADPDLPF